MTAKGGGRAIYRNIYALPVSGSGPVRTMTMRMPEFLAGEAGARSERHLPTTRSDHEPINTALEELARRCIVQLEGALVGKGRVSYIALTFVIDTRDTPLLLWPHEVRTLDVALDGHVVLPLAAAGRAEAGGVGEGGGRERWGGAQAQRGAGGRARGGAMRWSLSLHSSSPRVVALMGA